MSKRHLSAPYAALPCAIRVQYQSCAVLHTIEDVGLQYTVYQHGTEVASLKSGVLNKILLRFKVKIVWNRRYFTSINNINANLPILNID